MSRVIGIPCYYCGQSSSGREHVPAKALFRGFQCSRITVPACPTHNTSKSGDDQAVVSMLLQAVEVMGRLGYLTQTRARALQSGRSAFSYTKQQVTNRQF